MKYEEGVTHGHAEDCRDHAGTAQMCPMEWRALQKARIDLRVEKIIAHAQRVKREIDAGRVAGEEGRVWLDAVRSLIRWVKS